MSRVDPVAHDSREALLMEAYISLHRFVDRDGVDLDADEADLNAICTFVSAMALHQIAHDVQKITMGRSKIEGSR